MMETLQTAAQLEVYLALLSVLPKEFYAYKSLLSGIMTHCQRCGRTLGTLTAGGTSDVVTCPTNLSSVTFQGFDDVFSAVATSQILMNPNDCALLPFANTVDPRDACEDNLSSACTEDADGNDLTSVVIHVVS